MGDRLFEKQKRGPLPPGYQYGDARPVLIGRQPPDYWWLEGDNYILRHPPTPRDVAAQDFARQSQQFGD